jgi:hypothetical protein
MLMTFYIGWGMHQLGIAADMKGWGTHRLRGASSWNCSFLETHRMSNASRNRRINHRMRDEILLPTNPRGDFDDQAWTIYIILVFSLSPPSLLSLDIYEIWSRPF